MSLKFIDVYSGSGVALAGRDDVDGVIVKATQGTTYVNPIGDQQYQLAKSKGKLLGFYHYAGGGDPIAEADFFYKNTKNYFGEAVPCLDWESNQNSAWNQLGWCEKFVDRIHDLTGVWCLLYTGVEGIQANKSLATKCGLWLANYPDNRSSWDVPTFNVDVSPWKAYTLWQFTSSAGTLDREIAAVDVAGWKQIANPDGKSVAPQPAAKPAQVSGPQWVSESQTYTLTTAVKLRTGASTSAGVIATLAAGQTVATDAAIIQNGYRWVRQPRSGGFGYLATGPVGDTLAYVKAGVAHTYYTVTSGDSLWAIAQRHGTTVANLCGLNGISDSHVIHPGDKLIIKQM